MSRFLRLGAFLSVLFFATNVFASGYTCPSYKRYTSCNEGYYLNGTQAGNSCELCPSGCTCSGGTAQPDCSVRITYNLNGGSGTAPSATQCTSGVSCSLQSGATTSFYRAGYVFKGWATSPTATTGSTSITVTASSTVYAIWSKCGAGTYKTSSAQASAACSTCPAGYRAGNGATAQSGCQASCAAGYAVLTTGGACTSIQNATYKGKYITAHMVNYGATSTISTCPTNYQAGNGTTAKDECKIACPAGYAVLEEYGACESIMDDTAYAGHYTDDHTVKYGSKTEILPCPDGYQDGNGAATKTGCQVTCTAGYAVINPGLGCVNIMNDEYTGQYTDEHNVNYEETSDIQMCPELYRAGKGANAISGCLADCPAGYAVLTAGGAFTSIQNATYKGKYITAHMVKYGATSTISTCPTDYQAGNGTTAQANCKASCAAGYAVLTAGGACTSIQNATYKGKYITAHTVKYGATSTISACPTNYQTGNGTTAQANCKASCAAGYAVLTSEGACESIDSSAYKGLYTDDHYVTYGEKTELLPCSDDYQDGNGAATKAGCKVLCTAGYAVLTPESACESMMDDEHMGMYTDDHIVSYGDISVIEMCPDGYGEYVGAKGISGCKASCAAGYAVLTTGGACTSIQNATYKGKYITAHTVNYGDTTTISTCPTNYQAGNGTTAQSNCTTSCSAGYAVLTARGACTTIQNSTYKGKYITAHTVKYGATSTISTCPTNYQAGNGTTAQANCSLVTTAGKYVATAGAGETACVSPYYCPGGTTIKYGTGTTVGGNTACTSLGSFYTKSAGGATDSSGCYGTTTAGKYIKTQNSSTQETCPAGSYCPATNVYYGKYDTTGGRSNCTGATYSGSGAASCTDCPSGYVANTASNKTAASQCQISCAAGTRVARIYATCTSPAGAWFSAATTTNYGDVSPVHYCMAGYTSSSTAASGHDAMSDCIQTVAGGKYVGSTKINARYIKVTTAGSTANAGSHVVEIQAFASNDGSGTNLLAGKGGVSGSNMTAATDGSWNRDNYASGTMVWDMGAKQSIGTIRFALYTDGRVYSDVTVSVSMDNSTWTTVLGPVDVATQSAGTAEGELIFLSAAPASCAAGTARASGTLALGGTNSCSACGAVNKYSAAGASACSTVSTGYYTTGGTATTRTGQSKCTSGTYCTGGEQKTCPSGYGASAAGSDAASDCYMSVAAKKYVKTANDATATACGTGTYKAAHTVYYGGTSTCSSCPSGYDDGAAVATEGECVISVAGGKYVGTANSATLSTCAGGTYKAQHTVAYGSTSSCATCSAGYYCPEGASSQTACGSNNKYSSSGASSCSTVSSGYYSTGGTSTTRTGQTKCEAGNYCSSGVKTACGGGKYSAAGATSCSNITAGCYGTSASTACPAVCGENQYSAAGASSCSSCPKDYKNSGTTAASHAGSASCIITVSGGYYIGTAGDNSSNWDKCAGGTYKAQHTVAYGSTSSCSACSGRTKYSASGASSCSTVSAGYYTTGCNSSGNNCTGQSQCTGTTYCSSGVQNNCPSGYTYNTSAGKTAASSCTMLVPAAHYLVANASSATACGTGTWNPSHERAYGASSGCNSCPSGYDDGAAVATEGECVISVAGGKYVGTANSATLSTCAGGTYKAQHTVAYGSTSSCAECGAVNKYSAAGASACSTVSTGYYTTGGTTTTRTGQSQCTSGTYCTGGEQKTCPSGYGASAAGSDAASDCYMSVAAKKYVKTANDATATACGTGTYKAAHTVYYGGTSTCSSCPSGYDDGAAVATEGECVISVAGGKYVGTANSATLSTCAGGTYKAQHTVAYGSTSSCATCSAGYYCPEGAGSQTECGVNTKYSSSGASSCSTVSTGYYTTGGTSTTRTGQTKCEAGNYCSGGVKTACGGGRYSSAGATSCSNITAGCYGTSASSACPAVCGTNQYSTAGSSSCSSCPTDYKNSGTEASSHANQSSCKITVSGGYYIGTAGDNSSNWDKCAGGTYKAQHTVAYGSTSSCATCSAGYYCPEGASGQTACGGGKYSSAGATSCSNITAGCYGTSASTACPAVCGTNQYSAAGASSCSSCPTDYKNSGTEASSHAGAASCKITVSGGYYIGTAGDNSSNWDKCAGGTYKASHTVAYGSTSSCATCSAGYYCPEGASVQTACGGNTKYSSSGAAACSDVSSGYYSTGGTSTTRTGQTKCEAGNYCSGGVKTACSTLASGFYPNSAAGSDAAADCYTNSISGKYVASVNAASATSCAAGTYKGSHTVNYGSTSSCGTCPANSYCPAGSSAAKACSTLASGFYPNSAAGSYAAADCYTNVLSGKYVASANATGATSCAAGKFKGAHVVNYGSTSSCDACALGSYSAAGASACTACQNGKTTSGTGKSSCDATCVNNNSYDSTWATATWSDNAVANLCQIATCAGGSRYTSTNGKATGTLPSGYTQLAYLESTGKQYIDTGVHLLFGDEFYFDYMKLYSVSDEDKGYGAGINLTNNITGGGRKTSGNVVMFIANRNVSYSPSLQFTESLTQRYVEHWKITTGRLVSTLTNVNTKALYTLTSNNGTLSSSYDSGNNLLLFKDNTTQYPYPSAQRVYGTWLKRIDGNFAFNLIPAKRDSDGALGMYDTVNNRFLVNSGTGTFVAGPAILKSQNTCTQCAAGTYSAGGTATSCETCANWTYSSAGAASCTACLAVESGWTKASGTGWESYASCKETKTGDAINSNCSAGVLTKAQSSATAWGSATITTALQADAGSIVNGQTCTQCAAGTYSAGGTATSCGTCANWTYSSAGATSCTACLSVPDAVGGVAWTKATGTGWTSFNKCVVSQTPVNCASGSVKRTQSSATAWGGTTLVSALKSKAGYYASTTATSCTICPAGSYCAANATAATDCPGSMTSNTGSDAITDCKISCAAGYMLAAGASACSACSGGYYCESGATYNYNATAIQGRTGKVTAGYYSSGGGLSATGTCLSGYSCGSCSTGTGANGRLLYSDAGAASCSECPAATGTLANRVTSYSGWWSNNIHNKITGCYANFSDSDDTATFRTLCYYNATDGTYGGANSSCQIYAPTECAGGYRSVIESAAEWYGSYAGCRGADCMKGKVCGLTDAGYYSPAGATTQTACAIGSYTDATGKSACTACSAGKTTTGTGKTSCDATCNNATGVHTWAIPRWSANSVTNLCTVSKCNANTYYTATTGTGYKNTCTACGSNSSTSAGNTSTTCTCTAGYTSTGSVSGATTSTSGCSLISDIACAIGEYVPASSTSCSACTAGYYCPSTAQTYSYSSSIQGRTACSAGTYQPNTGKTSCLSADKGYYVSGTAKTAQTACTGATYAANTGQSSCTACPKPVAYPGSTLGYYWDTTGLHTSEQGCHATIANPTISNGTLTATVCYLDTNRDYGTADALRGSWGCEARTTNMTCNGGYYTTKSGQFAYISLQALAANVCMAVGAGYWSANDSLTRTACASGLTTIGYGTGANEAEDCGRKLHAGANVIYLRSAARTSPSLRVKVGDTTFYGALSTSLSSPLKVKNGSTTYSVVNDWQ